MAEFMEKILSKPIQLADQVIKLAKEVNLFKEECSQITDQTGKLKEIFGHMVTQGRSVSYQRPLRRTVAETEQVLDGVIALLLKCCGDGIMKRVFSVIPTAAFPKILSQLKGSVGDFTQILRLLEFVEYHSYSYERQDQPNNSLKLASWRHFDLYYDSFESCDAFDWLEELDIMDGLIVERSNFSIQKYIPSVAYEDPNFSALWKFAKTGDYHFRPNLIAGYLIVVADSLNATSTNLQFHNTLWTVWPLIGNLYHTSQDRRSFGLELLLVVSQLSDEHKKVIIQEETISMLLKLMEEGGIKDQETIAKVIGTLGYDSESVIRMIDAGVCLKFAEVLKEGPMKVQAEVAWAISEFAANYPKSQDVFLQHNIVYLLIKHHLSFETVRIDQNAFVINKATSVLSIVMARSRLDRQKAMDESNDNKNNTRLPNRQNPSLRSTSLKGREEPNTKHQMQAMTARALCNLVKGNLSICCCVTESRALMWFVVLLDIGTVELQYHSAMALMEITAVAEEDTELRRSTFKRSSPVFKAFIDRLLKIIENSKSSVLIPSIKAIGNLAKTLRMTEARVLGLLVRLLNATEPEEVRNEAINSLTKLTCLENFLHVDYSKEIIRAGGVKLLVELVRRDMQLSALLLLCYIALDVPEDNALQEANVLAVLEWAAKQASMSRDGSLDSLLKKARNRLELLR